MATLAVGAPQCGAGMTDCDYIRIAETIAKQLQRGGLPSYVEFDDLKQAAMLALLEQRPKDEKLAYLVAEHAALDEIKSERRHWEGPTWKRDEMPEEEDPDEEPEEGLEAGLRVTRRSSDCIPVLADNSDLYEAIAELPQRQREAIELHYLEQLSVEEAATQMGIKIRSVKTHIERGLATLRCSIPDAAFRNRAAEIEEQKSEENE